MRLPSHNFIRVSLGQPRALDVEGSVQKERVEVVEEVYAWKRAFIHPIRPWSHKKLSSVSTCSSNFFYSPQCGNSEERRRSEGGDTGKCPRRRTSVKSHGHKAEGARELKGGEKISYK